MKLWNYHGRAMTMQGIVAESGVSIATIYKRLRQGLSIDEAASGPPSRKRTRQTPRMIFGDDGQLCTLGEYARAHNITYNAAWYLFCCHLDAAVESLLRDMGQRDVTPRDVVGRYAQMVATGTPMRTTPGTSRYVFGDDNRLILRRQYAREQGVRPQIAREKMWWRVSAELTRVWAEDLADLSAASIAARCAKK